MEDLSLHILDIAQNSIRAGARNIHIQITEESNILTLKIEDDGKGMDDLTLKNAYNPYFTTKKKKRIGLGLSLLSQACEETGGNLRIEKANSAGIKIIAIFTKDHIDMKPMGDIDLTMKILRSSFPEVNFVFDHTSNSRGIK